MSYTADNATTPVQNEASLRTDIENAFASGQPIDGPIEIRLRTEIENALASGAISGAQYGQLDKDLQTYIAASKSQGDNQSSSSGGAATTAAPTASAPQATNSNGTLNYGAASPASGGTTIWDLPKGLTAKEIFFDTGHHKTVPQQTSPTDEGQSRHGVASDTTPYQIMRSPQQLMAQFAALSANDPKQFLAIQSLLSSGVWGTAHVSGTFDHDTEVALGNAMLQYVKLTVGTGASMSFSDYLQKYGNQALALQGKSPGGKAATPTPTLMDPTNIRLAAQNAAMDALGHGLTEEQLNAFVDKFQNEQKTNYAKTGLDDFYSTNTKLPAEAQAYAQSVDPSDFKANQQTSYTDALVNMLAGPGASNRPNQQPVAAINP